MSGSGEEEEEVASVDEFLERYLGGDVSSDEADEEPEAWADQVAQKLFREEA